MSFIQKHSITRSLLVAAFAGVTVAVAILANTVTPAQAADAQWCLNKEGSQDCAYYTFAQCLASASGQGGQCDANSRYYDQRSYAQWIPTSRIIR